jgi:hypothetical protein
MPGNWGSSGRNYLGGHTEQLPGSALLFPIVLTDKDGSEGAVCTVLSVNEQDKS